MPPLGAVCRSLADLVSRRRAILRLCPASINSTSFGGARQAFWGTFLAVAHRTASPFCAVTGYERRWCTTSGCYYTLFCLYL